MGKPEKMACVIWPPPYF